MKRLSALLCTAALIACASQAHAFPTGRWRPQQLTFRTLSNGTQDSSSARRVFTQTTYDTTKSSPLGDNIAWGSPWPGYDASVVDTMTVMILELYQTPGSALTMGTTFDSALVVTQMSQDGGATFTTMTPTTVFDATRPAGLQGAIYVSPTGQNTVFVPYEQAIKIGGGIVPPLAAAPTDQQWFGVQRVRFIVQGCGATGEMSARLWFWVPENH